MNFTPVNDVLSSASVAKKAWRILGSPRIEVRALRWTSWKDDIGCVRSLENSVEDEFCALGSQRREVVNIPGREGQRRLDLLRRDQCHFPLLGGGVVVG